MLLRSFLPSVFLQEYVHSLGIVHFQFPKGAVIPSKPYAPRPETSLYFFPRDPEYIAYPGNGAKMKRCLPCIHGQHTLMNNRFVGEDFLTVIVNFQPGVLYRLTGMPQNELTNRYVDAELLLTKDVNFVNEKLNECDSYQEMLSVVESFLIKLIRQTKREAHRVDAAAQYFLQRGEQISMDWLARETCLSSKQFERKFRERTGVTASTLGRINRFTRTVRLKNAQPNLDWLSIAVQSGYYDYQHLVRDYKEFTGLTPNTFFGMEVKAPERTFGLYEESKLYTV
jgi:AraC-like DNA-binding protein